MLISYKNLQKYKKFEYNFLILIVVIFFLKYLLNFSYIIDIIILLIIIFTFKFYSYSFSSILFINFGYNIYTLNGKIIYSKKRKRIIKSIDEKTIYSSERVNRKYYNIKRKLFY